MGKFEIKKGTQFFLVEGEDMDKIMKKVNKILNDVLGGEIMDWKLGHDTNGYVNLGFFYSPAPKPTELEKLIG